MSQGINVSSKSAKGPTSEQTNHVSDSKAINPKQPSTFKKTCQVHDTTFKLKVISWHIDNSSTQQQTANHLQITQSTLCQWVKRHEHLKKLVLKNSGSLKRIRPAKNWVLQETLFAWTMEAHAHHVLFEKVILKEKAIELALLSEAHMKQLAH